jgi:hypothetical protein
MLVLTPDLTCFISEKVNSLECSPDARAYIVSIFKKYNQAKDDYSKDSITILYSDARTSQNFEKFQLLGDWLFFSNSLFPESLKNASEEYYYTIGKLSYYSCFRLIKNKWPLFEELGDKFEPLVKETGKIIKSI